MIYYRISDKGNPKPKLPGATKKLCFINFLNCFKKEEIIVIADNCNPETIGMIKQNFSGVVKEVNIGNTASFHLARKDAMCLPDNEIIYFVEDDYLHLEDQNLMKVIKEGLEKVEYLTLFDHPDKYFLEYNAPADLTSYSGFIGEVSPVYRTKSTRWKLTACICMTFATKAQYLKEDVKIWDQYELPHITDYKIFNKLRKEDRKIAVAIPSLAVHTDISWLMRLNKIDELTEPWAIEYLTQKLQQNEKAPEELIGYQKLMFLDKTEPRFYYQVLEPQLTAEATVTRA